MVSVFQLTCREQKTIDIENRVHYQALRERWVITDATLPNHDLAHSPPYMELSDREEEEDSNCSPAAKADGDIPKCSCNFRYEDVLDEERRPLLQILEFPAKVHATRQAVDLEKSYPQAKRIILRDVLRTDRQLHYFRYEI